ncbi:Formamidopyrimidine-DNA glycosylase [Streptomyces cyaneofuscatus]
MILDEVHAVAGTKRGAHLALSLERLDELLPRPARRIGLSATVRPVDDARFLSPQRKVEIVQPPSTKEFDLSVVVPVEDLGELGGSPATDGDAAQAEKPSIWPHVEERIADLVQSHRSTIVFANSRRLAERLCNRLNEIAYERATGTAFDPDNPDNPALDLPEAHAPAEVMAQSGAARGAPALLARAHHGSVSKEQRAQVEEDLKAGRLPAVVATSSLELGIDMGAVDLVVQVESPPSVASGLQRVGRAGHQVGAVSTGVVFPKYRGDLVQAAVVTERMRTGAIEALRIPSNPLDVLAQQLVAMVALDSWQADDLLALVRRAAPFASLPESAFTAVLDMLAGRYPSDAFAELRPRVVWDRVGGTVTGRPGAQRLAVTSGGTIPDRGLFGVFLAGADPKKGGGRVGELDEEMVYESRVGDVFTLGTTSWRIEDITRDRVLVSPAPGVPGRLPFWKGDQLGRPLELGRALGAFLREIGGLSEEDARLRLLAAGLDAWAADNILAYLDEQRRACGHVPDDRTILVERFRDELGDWRVVVHSPFGAQVHAPWALALSARLGERYGMDAQVMHADDGIVLRLPDADMMGLDLLDFDAPPAGDAANDGATPQTFSYDSEQPPVGATDVVFDQGEVQQIVTDQVGGSALFAARFRECAARALLLPRRSPGKRTPLWQQRQRASQLLQVASEFGSFPIVLEAVRECLQDVFDVPGLTELMGDLEARRVRLVEVTTQEPSPFARSLLFGYVAQFLYEGDSPLAERRAAALSLDSHLLAELLGQAELRELLDPEVLTELERELQWLTEERRIKDAKRRRPAARARPPDRRRLAERGAERLLGAGAGHEPPGHPGPDRRGGPLARAHHGGMPEGDTVLQTAARLHAALAGRADPVDLRVPRFATADLSGRTVLTSPPRQHLLTRVEGGLTLHSHLRMDGAWRIYAPGERWRGRPRPPDPRGPRPTPTTPPSATASPSSNCCAPARRARPSATSGPDLLGPDWDPDLAVERLLAAPDRPLGEALLDQRNLAGIGNVYKCELCFLARVTPWLPVGALPDGALPRLVALAHRLLDANRDRPTRTTTIRARAAAPRPGTPPPAPAGRPVRPLRVPEPLYVYGRGGRPCLRCGTPIRKIDQEDRPTYWCPACQAGPTP